MKSPKHAGGRPKIPVDLEKVERLASILCTQSEIASVLGISLSVLEHNVEFQRVHKKGMESGKASLRRMQYAAASEGNVTMQIWLGKQYLGQRDRTDSELSVAAKTTIELRTDLLTDEEVIARAKTILAKTILGAK